MGELLLEIKNLQKKYPIYGPLGKMFPPKTYMNAVSNMSLKLYEGETYGLVGESGCGKTTLMRTIAGLKEKDEGHDLVNVSSRNSSVPHARTRAWGIPML